MNVHFHMLVIDGVYTRDDSGTITFTELRSPLPADLERLTRGLHRSILRFLRKRGKLPAEDKTADDGATADALSAHELCMAGAVQQALGPAAGHSQGRLFAEPEEIEPRPSKRGEKLSCSFEGFSLHAGTRVSAGADFALERLCRYVVRPPLATERLSLLPDGRVSYALKKKWSDGTTHIVLTPLALLERLAALVPRPRFPLVTYHGVLAPAAPLRPHVVPELPEAPKSACAHDGGQDAPPAAEPRPSKGKRRRYYTWSELMAGYGPSTFWCALGAGVHARC